MSSDQQRQEQQTAVTTVTPTTTAIPSDPSSPPPPQQTAVVSSLSASRNQQQQQPRNLAYQILLDALGAFRNGLVYGSKVRAPHSFVVYALWSSSSWPNVFQKIITLTTHHATNLAVAAALFKVGMHLLKQLSAAKTSVPWHYFLMGGIGGYFVWGEPNAVNTQVNMYMLSRVLSGLVYLFFEMRERQEAEEKKNEKLLQLQQEQQPDVSAISVATPKSTGDDTSLLTPTEQFIFGPRGYRVFVGCVWATALYLFHHHEQHVQSSLKMSMQYIYKDGDKHGGSLRKLFLGF